MALLLVASATGCRGSGPAPTPPALSTIRAEAILTSERPVSGHEKVFHGPLFGYAVIAVGADGRRTSAPIDQAGIAALRLPAGRYVLTTTDNDACPPATVTLTAAQIRTVNLRCVAP